MTWTPPRGAKKRYGWNTPVTAPGPKGSQMFRNLRDIQHNPLPFLEETWQEHGDVLQFPIPVPATYLVSSPEGARDVLVNHHKVTNKRTIQYTTLSLVTGDGLLTADTEAWRPVRRQLAPAFHHEMIGLVTHHVNAALNRLDATWFELTKNGPAIVDIDHVMMTIALEITGASLFGSDLSVEADTITQATLRALHGVVVKARNPLPIPLSIPTKNNVGMRKAIQQLDRAVHEIIAERKRNPLPEGAPLRDMLDVLLDQDVDKPLTAKQVRDEVATFIVAGHETVASALTWAWKLLGENPQEVELLREDPERSTMVFDETLRLYPPAWVITRRTLEPLIIDNHDIPADSMIIVSPWLVHRHTSVWENPNAFMPERFAEGVPQRGYIPFGAGARLCIGRDMARLEGAMIIEHLVQKWRISPIHSEEVPMDASVTLRPQGGLPMRVERLS